MFWNPREGAFGLFWIRINSRHGVGVKLFATLFAAIISATLLVAIPASADIDDQNYVITPLTQDEARQILVDQLNRGRAERGISPVELWGGSHESVQCVSDTGVAAHPGSAVCPYEVEGIEWPRFVGYEILSTGSLGGLYRSDTHRHILFNPNMETVLIGVPICEAGTDNVTTLRFVRDPEAAGLSPAISYEPRPEEFNGDVSVTCRDNRLVKQVRKSSLPTTTTTTTSPTTNTGCAAEPDAAFTYRVGSHVPASTWRLYQAFFLRQPDTGGFNYWVGVRDDLTLWDQASLFASSEEFRLTYGALSNADFVSQLYRNIFCREPDAGGHSYWTNLLDSGRMNRGVVVVNFSESAEYLLRTGTSHSVYD